MDVPVVPVGNLWKRWGVHLDAKVEVLVRPIHHVKGNPEVQGAKWSAQEVRVEKGLNRLPWNFQRFLQPVCNRQGLAVRTRVEREVWARPQQQGISGEVMADAAGLHENVHTLEIQRATFDKIGDSRPRGVGLLFDTVDNLHENGEVNVAGISQRQGGVGAEENSRLGDPFLQLPHQVPLGLSENEWRHGKIRRHHHGPDSSANMPDVRFHGISFRAT